MSAAYPKICIAGKNEISVHGLKLALETFNHSEVVTCPNEDDDGISRWQPSLRRFSNEWGVKIVTLEELYDQDDLIFLSLEFDKIIRTEKFKTNKLFNVHFSLLPAYKGMFTSAWPILNGESVSGVTLHKIDSGIDTGDIIEQEKVVISSVENCRSLYFKYLSAGMVLLDRCFHQLVSGNCRFSAQHFRGSSYYSKKSINYNNLQIDINNTAESIERQSRAYHFREFQIPQIHNYPICNGVIIPQRSRLAPGNITADGDDGIVVSTIDYDIRFERDRSWDLFKFVEDGNLNGIMSYAGQVAVLDRSNASGWTPLIIAAFEGKIDICRALIEAGVDLNKPNRNGTTPLMYAKDYAIKTGDFSVCSALLDAGCDLFARDRFGNTVLDYVVKIGHTQAMSFFGGIRDA